MPHKRAKRSVREQQRSQKGADLAPTKYVLDNEAVPKSLARVLNAAHIREDWKDKKRKSEDDGESRKDKKKRRVEGVVDVKTKSSVTGKGKILGIQPGESLAHFNRRVEDDMRPLVKSAMQSSLVVIRKARKAELEAKALAKKNKNKGADGGAKVSEDRDLAPPLPIESPHAGRPKEFQTISSSAPRRLNDIAQAPPEFQSLPRGVAKATRPGSDGGSGAQRDGVLSMAQKLMMDEEREKAIVRYRAMKAQRRKDGGGNERDRNGHDDDDV